MATATKPKPTKKAQKRTPKGTEIESIQPSYIDIEKNNIGWIKWIIGLGFTLVFGMMTYLISDLKSEIKINRQDIQSIKSDISEIKSILKNKR